MRRLAGNREAVDQTLRIFDWEIDDARELAFVFWVADIESLGDEDSVVMVLRKDDRFPEAIPTRHLLAARH